VLEAVFGQDTDFRFEVVIVDSGSSELDIQRMCAFPVLLHKIPGSAFGHGRTRNLLGTLARGQLLLYLSQDAEPTSREWMRTLIAPLADENVAGTYARQLPRADASPLMRFFLYRTYGSKPIRRHLAAGDNANFGDIFFSNVSSALSRAAWARIPFRDHVVMSEDQYWANDVLRNGFDVVYCPAAQVYHSHNYSLANVFRRNWLSGASLHGLIADRPLRICMHGVQFVLAELLYLIRSGQWWWVPYMLLYEASKSLGFALGMRSTKQL
jgi:rhamnosyltransferase